MAVMTRTDSEIKQDVLDEIDWDPEVDAPDVGVQVNDGVVTLTGVVDSYAIKLAAERAAHRVDGVRAVANNLQVKLRGERTDTDIAKDAADALARRVTVPADRLDVTVQNGVVTLKGEVDWSYQRSAAESAVEYLRGVRSVVNLITIKQPKVSSSEIKDNIERALVRAAETDADRIRVQVEDGHVILTGTVRSWAEKQEAGSAAWRAQGVTRVTNDIVVRP